VKQGRAEGRGVDRYKVRKWLDVARSQEERLGNINKYGLGDECSSEHLPSAVAFDQ